MRYDKQFFSNAVLFPPHILSRKNTIRKGIERKTPFWMPVVPWNASSKDGVLELSV